MKSVPSHHRTYNNSIFFNSNDVSQEGADGPAVSSMDCDDTGGGRGKRI